MLISPEVPGSVVSLSDVSVTKTGISARLVTPPKPGLYRLAVSIHDRDGVAFGTRTQGRIPAFTVRVTAELSGTVSTIDRLVVAAGARVDLPVSVANTGHLAWVSSEPTQSVVGPFTVPMAGDAAALWGRWLRLDGSGVASDAAAARATITPRPGTTENVVLAVTAPLEPGSYLLVLDVVSPLFGSMAAIGGSPTVVRVQVTAPDTTGANGGDWPDRPGGRLPSR